MYLFKISWKSFYLLLQQSLRLPRIPNSLVMHMHIKPSYPKYRFIFFFLNFHLKQNVCTSDKASMVGLSAKSSVLSSIEVAVELLSQVAIVAQEAIRPNKI